MCRHQDLDETGTEIHIILSRPYNVHVCIGKGSSNMPPVLHPIYIYLYMYACTLYGTGDIFDDPLPIKQSHVLSLQTYFLPVIGLVEPKDLSPGDLVVRQQVKTILIYSSTFSLDRYINQ